MDILVFCINTIPDIDGARRIYDLHGLSDEDVAKAILHKRRQQADTELLPHHLQKIVAISAVLSRTGRFRVWSLGDEASDEQDLLLRFYDGLERYAPRLVSWGGSGLDLPVIHYRSLLYPLNAQGYWTGAQQAGQIPTQNSISQFHDRHTDLQQILASSHTEATVSLNELAILCGFPGAMDEHAVNVWQHWLKNDVSAIREHGEARVMNTYLLYLNWARNRGNIIAEQYERQCTLVREELIKSEQPHLIEFEKNWIHL